MKNAIIRVAIILCIPAVMLSCNGAADKSAQSEAQKDSEKVVKVRTATVVRRVVEDDNIYSSTVQPYVVNNIAPQSGSRIQALNVEVGDFVSAGQVLAEMDKVQLEQAKLKLLNAKTELDRLKELFEEGGVSQSDYESMELSYNVSNTTYENILENTILKSPIDGVVTARNYDRGDMYTMAQPIYTVQQITPVKLLVGVSESDYSKVKKGQNLTLTADAVPGVEFSAYIKRIYPTMDASSHTFNVEVVVPNKDRRLRPGMYARVKIVLDSNNSMVVPDSAVMKMQGSGQKSVFVLREDGTVELKLVTVGRHAGDKMEILSGVREGEKVVISGLSSLRSGTKVEEI